MAKQRKILTAAEWQKRIAQDEAKARKDERHFEKMRLYELSVEDLRDETMSIVRNTFGNGETAYEEIHARNGAHPSTLKAWDEKRIMRPHMSKIRSVLLACGYDLSIQRIGA